MKVVDLLIVAGFHMGRMISGSKTVYHNLYPRNEVYFNANIFTEAEGKIWYGDLDLTRDREALQEIASASGESLYILREADGRFGNEELAVDEVKEKAVAVIS